METPKSLQRVPDLTTLGSLAHADAQALALYPPQISKAVPGQFWTGTLSDAKALVRLPDEEHWNGKLMIGGIPAVRSEYALDWLLSDLVVQRGYAYAACDKATPGLALRDAARSILEWTRAYEELTVFAKRLVLECYGTEPARTYIAGVSNGGYVVRRMLEQHPDFYDGGVDWEGPLWHPEGRHLLTTLPTYVTDYPVYANWRGDFTQRQRNQAYERLLEAGLHPESLSHWSTYFMVYWVISLWLYGRNLDCRWKAFAADWSNDWLRNPEPLAGYPWQERKEVLDARIRTFQNNGNIGKPLLSVAGNWDCLVAFSHNAGAYQKLVRSAGRGHLHRLYEIDRGNHVDGLLQTEQGKQQPVLPFFEACLLYLEKWVENGGAPPESGIYGSVSNFAGDMGLQSLHPRLPRPQD